MTSTELSQTKHKPILKLFLQFNFSFIAAFGNYEFSINRAVDTVIMLYERLQRIQKRADAFIDAIEAFLSELVDQLSSDYPLLGQIIKFTNMNIAIVEAIRSFIYIFQFVNTAINSGISAFEATNVFFDNIG